MHIRQLFFCPFTWGVNTSSYQIFVPKKRHGYCVNRSADVETDSFKECLVWLEGYPFSMAQTLPRRKSLFESCYVYMKLLKFTNKQYYSKNELRYGAFILSAWETWGHHDCLLYKWNNGYVCVFRDFMSTCFYVSYFHRFCPFFFGKQVRRRVPC